MRRHGRVTTAQGLGPRDHVCWTYTDEREFHQAVVDFLHEGVRLGQRLLYVGAHEPEVLLSHLAPLQEVGTLLTAGALEVQMAEDVYGMGPIDPEAQLERFARATQRALADGFTGLRVAADVTSALNVPGGAEALAHWEIVADRFMCDQPMAALCGLDRKLVERDTLTAIACLHPLVHADPVDAPFRLFAGCHGLRLAGEVDCFSAAHLRGILATAITAGGSSTLALDGLTFADHHGVLALAECGHTLDVSSAPPPVAKLCRLMDISL